MLKQAGSGLSVNSFGAAFTAWAGAEDQMGSLYSPMVLTCDPHF
jgi:hypothetical protein